MTFRALLTLSFPKIPSDLNWLPDGQPPHRGILGERYPCGAFLPAGLKEVLKGVGDFRWWASSSKSLSFVGAPTRADRDGEKSAGKSGGFTSCRTRHYLKTSSQYFTPR